MEDLRGSAVREGLRDPVIALDPTEGRFALVLIPGFKLFVLGRVVFAEDLKVLVPMEASRGTPLLMTGGTEIIGGPSLRSLFPFAAPPLLSVVLCDRRVAAVDEEDLRKGFGDDGAWFCSAADTLCLKEFRVASVSLVLLLSFIGVCAGVEAPPEFSEGA